MAQPGDVAGTRVSSGEDRSLRMRWRNCWRCAVVALRGSMQMEELGFRASQKGWGSLSLTSIKRWRHQSGRLKRLRRGLRGGVRPWGCEGWGWRTPAWSGLTAGKEVRERDESVEADGLSSTVIRQGSVSTPAGLEGLLETLLPLVVAEALGTVVSVEVAKAVSRLGPEVVPQRTGGAGGSARPVLQKAARDEGPWAALGGMVPAWAAGMGLVSQVRVPYNVGQNLNIRESQCGGGELVFSSGVALLAQGLEIQMIKFDPHVVVKPLKKMVLDVDGLSLAENKVDLGVESVRYKGWELDTFHDEVLQTTNLYSWAAASVYEVQKRFFVHRFPMLRLTDEILLLKERFLFQKRMLAVGVNVVRQGGEDGLELADRVPSPRRLPLKGGGGRGTRSSGSVPSGDRRREGVVGFAIAFLLTSAKSAGGTPVPPGVVTRATGVAPAGRGGGRVPGTGTGKTPAADKGPVIGDANGGLLFMKCEVLSMATSAKPRHTELLLEAAGSKFLTAQRVSMIAGPLTWCGSAAARCGSVGGAEDLECFADTLLEWAGFEYIREQVWRASSHVGVASGSNVGAHYRPVGLGDDGWGGIIGQYIQWYTDNRNNVAVFEKGYGSNPILSSLVQEMVGAAIPFQFQLRMVHIGRVNVGCRGFPDAVPGVKNYIIHMAYGS
ncbi:hypothetical protein BC829DRAFT_445261 [Chytridium lagenaria]|nr:hypothetical protein BC829DRAFT_445261 [Chytridium lagenaria]